MIVGSSKGMFGVEEIRREGEGEREERGGGGVERERKIVALRLLVPSGFLSTCPADDQTERARLEVEAEALFVCVTRDNGLSTRHLLDHRRRLFYSGKDWTSPGGEV